MIYFINTSDGHIKIGYSADPEERVAACQSGNHIRLSLYAVIPGGRSTERRIHERFRHLWSGGGWEWYEAKPELLAWIDKQVEAGIPNELYDAWAADELWAMDAILNLLSLEEKVERKVGPIGRSQLRLWDESIPSWARRLHG